MEEKFPSVLLLPNNVKGFIHIVDNKTPGKIEFLPLNQINEKDQILFSHFLFTHRIPKQLKDKVPSKEITIIDLHKYNVIIPNQDTLEASFKSADNTTTLRFANSFYLVTFITQLSLNHTLAASDNQYEILTDISSFRPPIKSISKLQFTGSVHDLYAHQSLLEYLSFPLDAAQAKTIKLDPFDESWILKLLDDPHDPTVLANISRSLVPREYCPLVILLLLLDQPIYEGEFNSPTKTHTNHENNTRRSRRMSMSSASPSAKLFERIGPIIPRRVDPAHPPLYIIDDLQIGGSSDIAADYAALKSQWTSITATQWPHMSGLRISFKLLENALTSTYPMNHPLVRVVFDVMASLFVSKDEFEPYVSELFYISTAVAELFLASEQTIDLGFAEGEHVVFWAFFALISRTEVVEFLEQRQPEELLKGALKIIITMHPLLHTRLEKAGADNLKMPANMVFALFAGALPGRKLFPLWAAALASEDPTAFFQHLVAAGLILAFPAIAALPAETPGPAILETVERELRRFFEENSAEVLIAYTLKLLVASHRN